MNYCWLQARSLVTKSKHDQRGLLSIDSKCLCTQREVVLICNSYRSQIQILSVYQIHIGNKYQKAKIDFA